MTPEIKEELSRINQRLDDLNKVIGVSGNENNNFDKILITLSEIELKLSHLEDRIDRVESILVWK